MQNKIRQTIFRAAAFALAHGSDVQTDGELADRLRLLRLLTADDIRALLPADTVAALDDACKVAMDAVACRIEENPTAFVGIDDYDVPYDIEFYPEQVLEDIMPTVDASATSSSHVTALQCVSEILVTHVIK